MGFFSIFDSKQHRFENQCVMEYEHLMVCSYSFGLSGISENGLGSHEKGIELLNDTYKSLLAKRSEITQKGFDIGVTIHAEDIVRKSYENAIKNIVVPATTTDSRMVQGLKKGKALDRLAHSFTILLKLLDEYKQTQENENLVIGGWYFIFGIHSSLLKWHWNVNSVKFKLHGYEEFGKITISEAMEITAKKYDATCSKYIPNGSFVKIFQDEPTLYLECTKNIPLTVLYDLLP